MGGSASRQAAFKRLDDDAALNTASSGLYRTDPAQLLLEQEVTTIPSLIAGEIDSWHCAGKGWIVSATVRTKAAQARESEFDFTCRWWGAQERIDPQVTDIKDSWICLTGTCSACEDILPSRRTQFLAGQSIQQSLWVHTEHSDVQIIIIPPKSTGEHGATVLENSQNNLGVKQIRIPYSQVGAVLLRFFVSVYAHK